MDPISVSCGKSSQLFATKRVKPWKIWKISWFPVSVSVFFEKTGNFSKFLLKHRGFFSKTKVFKHFWTLFPFPVAKFRNFLPKFLKNQLPFPFFSIFAIFGPHFHQLFATRRVKPWKFWKISWFPVKNSLPFPVFKHFSIFRPHFHQLFATITPKTWDI